MRTFLKFFEAWGKLEGAGGSTIFAGGPIDTPPPPRAPIPGPMSRGGIIIIIKALSLLVFGLQGGITTRFGVQTAV